MAAVTNPLRTGAAARPRAGRSAEAEAGGAWEGARLTGELLKRALREGRDWLVGLAEQGRLTGELRPLRRLAWAHLLGILSGDMPEQWEEQMVMHRRHYTAVIEQSKRQSLMRVSDPNVCNPLSRNSANPFVQKEADEDLLSEIWKDVERTFPENQFLSSPDSRSVMQRVLFHWCRLWNAAQSASESYLQGMNELVGVLWLVAKQGEYCEDSWEGSQALGARLCGRAFSEADTFELFSRLMQKGIQPMFIAKSSRPQRSPIGELPRSRVSHLLEETSQLPPTSAILARCVFINDTLVKTLDGDVHEHLRRQEIEPQVFLLRWLRLLFCREFRLDDTMLLWDAIFSDALQPQPPSAPKYPPGKSAQQVAAAAVVTEAAAASAALPLVDLIAAALLCSFRDKLLGLDQTECLRHLLRPGPTSACVHALVATAKGYRECGRFGGLPARNSPTMAANQESPHSPKSPLLPRMPPTVAAEVVRFSPPASPRPKKGEEEGEADGSLGGRGGGGCGEAPGGAAPSCAAPSRSGHEGGDCTAAAGAAGASPLAAAAAESNVPPPIAVELELLEMRQRLAAAEAERDVIRRKANEFLAKHKALWYSEKADLELRLAERDGRIAELERRLAEAGIACVASADAPEIVPEMSRDEKEEEGG